MGKETMEQRMEKLPKMTRNLKPIGSFMVTNTEGMQTICTLFISINRLYGRTVKQSIH